MAGPERQPDAPLAGAAEALAALAARLPFVSLVALLERLAGVANVGSAELPSAEAIRFRHDPALGFSPRDVMEVRVEGDAASPRFEVTTSFLGLSGSASPLPSYLLEEVLLEGEDAVRRPFLDLFHHRLIALLYRSLRGTSLPGDQATALDDAWSTRLLALCGVDAERLAGSPLSRAEVLSLAPLLAEPSRSARALEAALGAVIGPALGEGTIRVEPLAGAWVPIGPGQRWRLGRAQTRLGRDTLVGEKSFDRASGFAVHVGPVGRDVHQRLLPGADLRERLEAVIGLFVRDPLEHRVVVSLDAKEVEPLRLAARGRQGLGRDTWLGRTAARKTVTV